MAAASTKAARHGMRGARAAQSPWPAWLLATAALAALAAGGVGLGGVAGNAPAGMAVLALLLMMVTPVLVARSFPAHATAPTAATLLLAMFAMRAAPSPSETALSCALLAASGLLFALRVRFNPGSHAHTRHRPCETLADLRANSRISLLALLAGISSGTLARFQLFTICGDAGANTLLHAAVSLAAVFALGVIADRTERRRVLVTLYLLRGALLATLTTSLSVTLAPSAAQVLLVLDYLTIPTLMRLTQKSRGAIMAGCPGAAHHIGMLAGAALSTTPYFFNNGFLALFVFSVLLNLGCALALTPLSRFRTARISRRPVLKAEAITP